MEVCEHIRVLGGWHTQQGDGSCVPPPPPLLTLPYRSLAKLFLSCVLYNIAVIVSVGLSFTELSELRRWREDIENFEFVAKSDRIWVA